MFIFGLYPICNAKRKKHALRSGADPPSCPGSRSRSSLQSARINGCGHPRSDKHFLRQTFPFGWEKDQQYTVKTRPSPTDHVQSLDRGGWNSKPDATDMESLRRERESKKHSFSFSLCHTHGCTCRQRLGSPFRTHFGLKHVNQSRIQRVLA